MLDILQNFLDFFDHMAFSDNPHESSCYCYYVSASEPWDERTADMNRNAAITLIKAARMHGFLAYKQDTTIAWCHVDFRYRFERLRDLCSDEDEPKRLPLSFVSRRVRI